MKWADAVLTVDLSDGKTHTITIDPKHELETRTGEFGDYRAVLVSENGRAAELIVGKRLLNAIVRLGLETKTEITIRRTGEGFQTDYEVSVA